MRAFNTRVVGVAHTGLSNPMQWDVNELRAVCTHSAQVEPLHSWRGDLVCHGDLSVGSQCHARGSLKAHGSLELGPGCHVTGSVFAQGEIRLGAGCVVHGHVVSETAVLLAPGCVVGWMSQPATVAAPHIDVGPAVRVHGTLWAATMGRSWFAFDHERMPALAQVAA